MRTIRSYAAFKKFISSEKNVRELSKKYAVLNLELMRDRAFSKPVPVTWVWLFSDARVKPIQLLDVIERRGGGRWRVVAEDNHRQKYLVAEFDR